jgi:RNA polymerase sigma factor (sigma-70 family)
MGTFAPRRDSSGSVPHVAEPALVMRASFEEVYRSLRPSLIRVAFLIVGSSGEAEELVQEAFVHLHRRFETVDTPDAYVRVVLVRSCVRSNQRRAMESERLARVSALDRSPEYEVDEMWLALQRLSPQRRAVLVLRFYEDLPHAEIARLVGCPVATVRTRVRRALADLRKELGR